VLHDAYRVRVKHRLAIAMLAVAAIAGGCAIAASQPPGSTGQTSMGPSASGAATSTGRTASGIPETLDGQPVLIGLAAAVQADATTDASPFLVGGWFNDASMNTCSGGGAIGRDPSPLLTGCATGIGAASPPVDGSAVGFGKHVFWDGKQLPNGRAPAIVRVHTHDTRATKCRADSRVVCNAVLVVEKVLWAGDAWTDATPVSVVDAVRTLESITIITEIKTGPQSTLSVQRRLFTTPLDAQCPSPWPHEVFQLRGDPRFGLIAIFPDEQARIDAQAALDPTTPGCATDGRIERPAPATWAAHGNVLVLVYGDDIRARTEAALDGSGDSGRYTPFPPASLDEAYRVVDDAEAGRATGSGDGEWLLDSGKGDGGVNIEDLYRRFQANAVDYTISDGRLVTKADVSAELWRELQLGAVPGTARLFVVDHPAATTPALRTETIVAFRLLDPGVDTWSLIVVPAP
jgi:hypothetical protein